MLENKNQLSHEYDEQGFFVVRDYFTRSEISSLRDIILTFHESWKADNREFYEEVAFNSSLITGSQYLADDDRVKLFNFISCDKMLSLVESVIKKKPAFMNTQLFFNPVNPQLKDFWHRDCQYDHDLEAQQRIIKETQVVHLRVPLFDEPGMELIPGTHKRWDTDEELKVREETHGRHANESLTGGKSIPLDAGDILVFSADMLHRGIYGLDRLALDILVFESSEDYIDYIDDDCLPCADMLKEIENPRLYINTIELRSSR